MQPLFLGKNGKRTPDQDTVLNSCLGGQQARARVCESIRTSQLPYGQRKFSCYLPIIHQIFIRYSEIQYIYILYIYYIYTYYIYIIYYIYIYISIYLLQMHCQAWLRVGQALGQSSAACAAYALARGGFRHWILVAFAPVVELEFTICNCEVLNYVHSVLCTCNMIII